MRRRKWLASMMVLGSMTTLPGCFGQRLTLEEMRAAVDGVVLIGQARQAVDDVVEISTSFTIGQGIEAVVEEVRAFLESQAPCTQVEATPGQLVVDFGGLEDGCSYRGRTYGGQVVYSFVVDAEAGEVLVTHEYEGFTNGRVTLDGVTDVTWGGGARRVETDFAITGQSSSIDAQSDRTMTWIDESQGLAGGVRIEGTRRWQGRLGSWFMTIDEVEVRPQDPVPQAGRYELVTPRDVLASLVFERVDEDTIEVLFEGPRQRRVYHVSSTGAVSDEGEG